jgi:polyhydroxyalkanoate synthase subunit PhaC
MTSQARPLKEKTPRQNWQRPQLWPRPLPLLKKMAEMMWLSWPLASTNLMNKSAPWQDALAAEAALLNGKVAEAVSQHGAAAYHQAIEAEALARYRTFLGAIENYQQHPAGRDLPDMPVIAQWGTACLRDYGDGTNSTPLLIIPSLINRYHILDLSSERSFLRWLVGQGFRPLLIDWQEPGIEEQAFTFDDYLSKRLKPFLAAAMQCAEGKPVPVMGYCMGGLLALALACHAPHHIKNVTLLATPWDFHEPDKEFADHALRGEPALAGEGNALIDPDAVQSLFITWQMTAVLEKYLAFAKMDQESDSAAHFVCVEDWLNDGVPLSRAIGRMTLYDWYRDNKPARMMWQVAGEIIDPRKLDVPMYLVAPQYDKIVPPASAVALHRFCQKGRLLRPATGHIGMMVGEKAMAEMWQPCRDWWRGQGI